MSEIRAQDKCLARPELLEGGAAGSAKRDLVWFSTGDKLPTDLLACHRTELVYGPAGVSAGIAQGDWWRPVADPGRGGQGRQTQRRSRDDRPERQHRGEQDKDRCPVNIGPCERACQGRHALALQAEQEGAATKVLSRGPGCATKLAETRSLERIPPKPLPPIIRGICGTLRRLSLFGRATGNAPASRRRDGEGSVQRRRQTPAASGKRSRDGAAG